MVQTACPVDIAALPLAPRNPLPIREQLKAIRGYHNGPERLRDAGKTPRFINVSYRGATHHRVPEGDSFYPYADAKKTVDDRLNSTEGLEYLILGPSTLTLEPAVGYATPTTNLPPEDSHTSRELVAEIITVFADRYSLPGDRTVEFVDGYLPAGEI